MPETHFSALFQAITELLATHSDMFIGIGRNLFRGFAVILVAWFGIKTALSSAEGGSAFRLSELVSLEDVDKTCTLLAEVCRQVNGKTDFTAR